MVEIPCLREYKQAHSIYIVQSTQHVLKPHCFLAEYLVYHMVPLPAVMYSTGQRQQEHLTTAESSKSVDQGEHCCL